MRSRRPTKPMRALAWRSMAGRSPAASCRSWARSTPLAITVIRLAPTLSAIRPRLTACETATKRVTFRRDGRSRAVRQAPLTRDPPSRRAAPGTTCTVLTTGTWAHSPTSRAIRLVRKPVPWTMCPRGRAAVMLETSEGRRRGAKSAGMTRTPARARDLRSRAEPAAHTTVALTPAAGRPCRRASSCTSPPPSDGPGKLLMNVTPMPPAAGALRAGDPARAARTRVAMRSSDAGPMALERIFLAAMVRRSRATERLAATASDGDSNPLPMTSVTTLQVSLAHEERVRPISAPCCADGRRAGGRCAGA